MAPLVDDLTRTTSGILLTRELRRSGVHAKFLTRAVRAGSLVRLCRGAFVDAATWSAAPAWEKFRLRSLAVGLAFPSLVLSHASAAAVWGVPLLGSNRKVEVLAEGPEGGRVSGSVHFRGSRHPRDFVTTLEGVQLTGLPRTLVELAARTSFTEAVTAVDWALGERAREVSRGCTLTALGDVAVDLAIVRGRRKLAEALAFADGRSGSAGESLSRARMRELGVEIPDLQHEFLLDTGKLAAVDFRWARQRLVGEFDGLEKYRAAELRGGRIVAEVVVDEKRREDSIRRQGERVGRWTWADAWSRARFAAVLAEIGAPRVAR